MDVSKFHRDSPGDIVATENNHNAFIPQPLPPSWEFPTKLWPLLADAKQKIALLEGLGRTLPNPALLLRPLENREAIRSSSLEGTYATPQELLLFEMQPREPEAADDPANAWREVMNYRRSLDFGTTSTLPLSLRLIRQMHKILLTGVRGRDKAPGNFRQVQVYLGYPPRFVPPPPMYLMECLDALEKYFHKTDHNYDPLVICFLAHYQFEAIHPFVDGNGRVGRLLLAIMLKESCGLTKSWMYMSAFFEQHRDEYVDKLFNVSAKNEWSNWIEFCLHGAIEQATDATLRCEQLLKIRANYGSRLDNAGGSIRLHQIVEGLFQSPFVRTAELARQLGVTYPTAKSDIQRLIQIGILSKLDIPGQKTYYANEVFSVAYEDMVE